MKKRNVLLAFLLVIGSAGPAAAYNIPPFATDHEVFLADQGDPNLDPGPTTCNGQGSPLDVATGNFTQSIPLLEIPGRGPSISLVLTYHSMDHRKGPFGLGWTLAYDQRIVKTTDGALITAICAGATGRRDRYTRNADGSYASPPNLHNTLAEQSDGSWLLREISGSVRAFDAAGRLVSIVDRNGNALHLQYDASGFLTSLTDASGRTASLIKGANGRVAQITDPAGHQLSFGYDAAGNMSQLTDPMGNSTTLQYDINGHLTKLTDPKGNVLLTVAYNANGTVSSYKDLGETWTISYSPASKQTTEIDAGGNRWTHTYNALGSITRTVDPLGNTTVWSFDANSEATQITDANGHSTSTTYDANGNPILIQDALGKSVQTTFDPVFNQPLTIQDRLGNVTTFTYDTKGNLIQLTDALGGVCRTGTT